MEPLWHLALHEIHVRVWDKQEVVHNVFTSRRFSSKKSNNDAALAVSFDFGRLPYNGTPTLALSTTHTCIQPKTHKYAYPYMQKFTQP